MATPNILEKEDIFDILKMAEKGLTQREIAEKTGVSQMTISRTLRKYKFKNEEALSKKEPAISAPVPSVPSVPKCSTSQVERNETAKQVALSSISSRVLIKELYNRGYRIENGGLFVIEKKKVLVNDILKEA